MSLGEDGVLLMDAFNTLRKWIYIYPSWLNWFIDVSSLKWRIGSYSAQFVYYDGKGSHRKRQIYISFTRYPHDLRIQRESRDYTRGQMENSDSSYRDTRRDLKNVVVIAVTPGKDVTWSIPIITTTLSFQKTTIRLDARHRATNAFSITIVNSDTGKDTTWNWRPDGARGGFRRYSWTLRMLRTIDPER